MTADDPSDPPIEIPDAATLGLPEDSPFLPVHFRRADEKDDGVFYEQARLVTHIDEGAIGALGTYYAKIFPKGGAVLDLMSSWVSHFPADFEPSRAAGLGMNAEELAANPVLSERTVQDLNQSPTLPYDDASFDAVVIAVSVQYLQRPFLVFREIGRVLKANGICAVSFSNRCFPTKAISLWGSSNDETRIQIVGGYFHYAGVFEKPQAIDLSPGGGDPLYVVQARRARDGTPPTPTTAKA